MQKEAQSQEIGLSRNLNEFRIVGAKGSQLKGGGGPECKMIIRHLNHSKKLGFYPQGKQRLTGADLIKKKTNPPFSRTGRIDIRGGENTHRESGRREGRDRGSEMQPEGFLLYEDESWIASLEIKGIVRTQPCKDFLI